MIFSQRLKELREEKELSQAQLAIEFGVAQTTIASWELGKREPNIDMVIAISDFFRVSIDYLLGTTSNRAGFKVDENGFKIKTPAELADVGVESVVKTDNIPFTPEQVAEIQKMLNDHLRELENKG